MLAKSTNTHYGTVAVTIHWLSAILIIVLIGSGFRAANTINPDVKAQILSVHVPLAIATFVLTAVRILWWWFADKKPDPLAGIPKWQDVSASAVHFLFYIVIIGMVASGVGMFVLSGAGEILFGDAQGNLPDFWNYKPRIPHGIGARIMVALLVLHAGAALYHQFIKKDGSLRRMWFGKTARKNVTNRS